MINFEKKSLYHFLNILNNANLMIKLLQNVIFWKVGYPKILPMTYVPLVVSKLYTKFQ